MTSPKISEEKDYNRRRFLGIAAVSVAVAGLVAPDFVNAQSRHATSTDQSTVKPIANTSFDSPTATRLRVS